MIKKIRSWLNRNKVTPPTTLPTGMYTREQLEKAFWLGHTSGKRDGLAIAREQATKSLKEILWHANQSQKK
jgi:hypothetical protein